LGEDSIENLSAPDLVNYNVEIKLVGNQRLMVAKKTILPGEIVIKCDPIPLVLYDEKLNSFCSWCQLKN